MAGFKRSLVIHRPIEEVFDFATDLNNAPLLLPGVTKTEMLTEGGMKPRTGCGKRVGGRARSIPRSLRFWSMNGPGCTRRPRR